MPIISSVRSYNIDKFKSDLSAGVMVAVLLIPQAIAYAYLAGMPAEYGLYTALIPLLIYGLLGGSPHLAIGPVAISALLVVAGISQIATPFTEEYIELVILTGLCVGVLQVILGLFRMGFLLKYMTHPVVAGFTSAASIIIILSQLETIIGVDASATESVWQKFKMLILGCKGLHLPSFLVSAAAGIIIFISKKYKIIIPGGLIVVAVGLAVSYFFAFENMGIVVIGDVPSGLPSFDIPVFSSHNLLRILPTVIIVTVIGIIESLAIAKAMSYKNNSSDPESKYGIDANQEFLALGISKIFGSFFQAMPSSGSFSRSALLYDNKGKTTISSLYTVAIVVISLFFLTSSLYYLPKVILAVIIIFAVIKLFEWSTAIKYWNKDKSSFLIMSVTFLLTLLINIEVGVGVGIVLSFFMYKGEQH